MHSALATLALAALAVANPMIEGRHLKRADSLAGCSQNYAGSFSISQVNVSSSSSSSSKRDVEPRNERLTMTLHNGVLIDSKGRTGYIAGANNQFQFDQPPQAGAAQTSGFSVCANNTLALHSAVWWSCRSGGFFNLYDDKQYPQCFQVYLEVVGRGSAKSTSTPAAPASYGATSTPSAATGAATGSAKTPAAGGASGSGSGDCSQIGDGQPQCTSPAKTPTCGEGEDGQPACPKAAATPAPSPKTTATAAPSAACGVKSDGQPNCSPAPTYTGPPIPPAPNAASAFSAHRELFGLAAGLLALAVF